MNLFLYLLTVLIWGTTWIALKWQLGVVEIPVSIVYRFGLAALVLFLLLLLSPSGVSLLMLAVFTFVFGVVAPTRWPGAEAQGMGMFALRLLAGMVVHGLLAELLQRAPTLVTGQPNYVTKVVFPLEVLGWVALLTALFHALMALLVLVVLNAVWGTGLSPTVLALPLIVGLCCQRWKVRPPRVMTASDPSSG